MPGVDLTINKEVLDIDGDVVTYEIAVGNTGPNATTTPIVVTDPLPNGLEFVAVSGDGWSCTEGQVVTCTYAASLPVGESAAFELTARLTAKPGTEVVNVASVVAEGRTDAIVSDDAAVISPDETALGWPVARAANPRAVGWPTTGADVSLVAWGLLMVVVGWSAVGLSRRRRVR